VKAQTAERRALTAVRRPRFLFATGLHLRPDRATVPSMSARLAPAVLGSVLLLLGAFGGCALPGTGGELVEVSWAVRADVPAAPVTVESADPDPWTVELVEAQLLLGPVYAFEPFPASGAAARGVALLGWPFAAARARAHAGDDNTEGARVLAELLDQAAVDLLDPRQRALGRTIAEAGELGTVNVVFDEARVDLSDPEGPTRGGHALLRGVARRSGDAGDEVIRFAAVLDQTVPDDRIAQRLEALRVDGPALRQDARIELTADPRVWVRQMRFDDLPRAGSDDDELVLEEPSQFHNAWYLGLRDPAGWQARVELPDAVQGDSTLP